MSAGRFELLAERLRALHTPAYEVAGTTYTSRVTVLAEDMTAAQRLTHRCLNEAEAAVTHDEPCNAEEHQFPACSECRTSTPDYDTASFIFPCPTIQLLEEVETA